MMNRPYATTNNISFDICLYAIAFHHIIVNGGILLFLFAGQFHSVVDPKRGELWVLRGSARTHVQMCHTQDLCIMYRYLISKCQTWVWLRVESWVDSESNIYRLSHGLIWIDKSGNILSHESKWISTWESSWVMSWLWVSSWKAAWVMSWIDSSFRDTVWVMSWIRSVCQGTHPSRTPKKCHTKSTLEWEGQKRSYQINSKVDCQKRSYETGHE